MQPNKSARAMKHDNQLRYYIRHPKRELLHCARQRAKKRDCRFDLRETDFDIPEVCPILGIPLVRGGGHIQPGSPTLDRLVPALGYIKGNVWVISAKANVMKSDASPRELLRFAKWVLDIYES
jgi:hypothetical protein